MPRRKVTYPEKPWKRDPAVLRRWKELIDQGNGSVKSGTPEKPAKGWQLWRLDTLEDVNQDI